MKRLLAFSLALFLLIAALSSCAVTFSGSSATNAPPTDAAGTTSVTEVSTDPDHPAVGSGGRSVAYGAASYAAPQLFLSPETPRSAAKKPTKKPIKNRLS